MRYVSRVRLLAGLVLVVATITIPLVAVAGAATPDPNAPVTVGSDVSPGALPGATVFGTTPPDTPEQVSFILREKNEGLLAASVTHGLRNFLSVRQFAQLFGQSPATIAQLTSYLGRFGITTQVYADGLDVSASGTAGAFDQALSVQQRQYHVPAQPGHGGAPGVPAQTVHGPSGSPHLPNRIASSVLTVLGLSNYAPFTSHAVHVPSLPGTVKPALSGAECDAQFTPGDDADCNTPADFDTNYGLSPLVQHGANGSGQTIAIVTLAAVDPGAPQYYWQHIAGIPDTGRTVNLENVDGGAGAPNEVAGTSESDLDVEQSGGVAPGANVVVYQAPNTDPGFADGFFTAASQNIASTVSASWGESETYLRAGIASGTEPAGYVAAFDEVFLEMAAQGQSGFVSSGDSGAYDASADVGSTNLSVDTPGNSPYITSAGGTTLAWTGSLGDDSVSVSAQRAWGWDYLWPAIGDATGLPLDQAAEQFVAGDGGGFSVTEPTPSYQQGVPGTHTYHAVQYLAPTDPQDVGGITEPTAWDFNPTPTVTSGYATGRAEPDLSTDADPFTGYLLYAPSFAQAGDDVLEGGWGGTSFVAPQLNGSAAVIDSYLGHRVGLWNPSIYSFATSGHSPFTTMNQASTANDNLFYTGNPGAVYNPSTGLGYPNLSILAADFQRQR